MPSLLCFFLEFLQYARDMAVRATSIPLYKKSIADIAFAVQNAMPALVETIKELGLVLVADTSDEIVGKPTRPGALATANAMGVAAEWAYRMPEGVNGVMKANGVLRFNDTIDM